MISLASGIRVIGIADNVLKPHGNPAEPLAFLKDAQSCHGDGELIVLPRTEHRYWGEPELGFRLGRRAFKVTPSQAADCIGGYLIANDVTRDGPEGVDHHLMYSKAFEGSLIIGAHAPPSFRREAAVIRGYHNGVLLRTGTVADFIFDDATLVSRISQWMVLNEGDIVLTGAPNRVRDREYLRDGDEFRCEIDGIGTLTNRFTFGDSVG